MKRLVLVCVVLIVCSGAALWLGWPSLVERLLMKTEIISFAESLGGVETLITFPEVQTHADILPEIRRRLGINDVLLRLSVGIEDVNDLIGDLAQAFE